MTTTLQQMIAEPEPLLELVQRGEEVVLTDGGKPVVRMTGVAAATGTATTNDGGELAQPTAVPGPRKASPEALRNWMQKAAAAAAAGATGKRGMTVDEIIDDLRSERF